MPDRARLENPIILISLILYRGLFFFASETLACARTKGDPSTSKDLHGGFPDIAGFEKWQFLIKVAVLHRCNMLKCFVGLVLRVF